MTLKNSNFMGAKHAADITRAVIAGAGGRISKKAEREPDELTTAQRVRRTSLLGSVGMLRVLGGVFRGLRAGDNPAELDDIAAFFKRLDPHMTAPVTETRPRAHHRRGRRLRAERLRTIMRTQNTVNLVKVITS
ncbi:hypothetical protein SAMN05444920_14213 [Nonomuraea solani]|uniref:Uncharacterized protein n=1 Tax=Nonomuraea solani TaxID=1144553 RepID=A0A1H6F3S6_9ACTN|nr:hypothetical protein [Nonomuraea solani]SEH03695.1 hypothetical protein SAMN05444920_14213 [Nonomuraea solani]